MRQTDDPIRQAEGANASLLKEILLGALWFPALVFCSHAVLVWALGITSDIQGSDIPFHALGGVSIAYASSRAIGSLRRRGLAEDPGPLLHPVLIVSVTAAAAAGWEFFEFCCDAYLGTRLQVDLANTMSDMAFGILGGLGYVLGARWRRRRV